MDWKELGKQTASKSWELTKKGAAKTSEGVEKYAEYSSEKKKEKRAAQKEADIAANKAGLFERGIYCPKCRSKNVQFMQNNRKGFSVGKALGGAALTGGIGTLAGFAGKKGKNQWHCTNCGHVFKKK